MNWWSAGFDCSIRERSATTQAVVGILGNLKSPSLQIGDVGDRVRVLLALGRPLSVAELVEEVKFGLVVLMAFGLGWRGVFGFCPYRAGG